MCGAENRKPEQIYFNRSSSWPSKAAFVVLHFLGFAKMFTENVLGAPSTSNHKTQRTANSFQRKVKNAA